MKRCIILLIFLLTLAMPMSSLAAPAPLTKISSSASVSEDPTVQAVSYKANLKVNYNITQTNSTIVIKNTEDKRTDIMIGIPTHINQETIKLENLEVFMDGKNQRLIARRDRTKKEESGLSDIPARWYTWYVSLEPNGYKVIDISYTTENQKSEDGTKSIYIPLEFLKTWLNVPQNIEISVDLGDAPPYVFEPNPSVLPHYYDRMGRLNWKFTNDEFPSHIQVYFRNIEQLASEYISAQAAGDKSITSITKAFDSKSYYEAVALIDKYLESQNETGLKNELLYMKALANQGLYKIKDVFDIFDQLESQPIFGELEGTFKNRIIYDKYYHMKSLLTENTILYDYLDSAKSYVMGNALFLMWMEEELSYLESTFMPEPEPTPPVEQPPLEESNAQDENDEKELIKSITIGKYEISVEVLFLVIIALVILLTLIIRRSRRKKHRNRGYIFRY